MKNPKIIFYVVVGCLALFQILKGCNSDTQTYKNAEYERYISDTGTENKEPGLTQPVEVVRPNWEYDSKTDEMRGESSYFAATTSQNLVELDFPYQGGTDLKIMLRKDAEHGNDVIFLVNKGQLYCNYRDCYVSIKFDDGAVEKIETVEAAAGSSELLFLANNPSGFVNRLKSADTVMVEVQFYNHGKEQFKFDVSGLEWSHF